MGSVRDPLCVPLGDETELLYFGHGVLAWRADLYLDFGFWLALGQVLPGASYSWRGSKWSVVRRKPLLRISFPLCLSP